jgi:hypothetical protein
MGSSRHFAADQTLYRIVPRRCVDNGVVSSEAFEPRRRDNKRLSVSDGELIDAKGAYGKYHNSPGTAMAFGVLGITPQECGAKDLSVMSEPPPPEHVIVSFEKLGSKRAAKAAVHLRDKAVDRGWYYVHELAT